MAERIDLKEQFAQNKAILKEAPLAVYPITAVILLVIGITLGTLNVPDILGMVLKVLAIILLLIALVLLVITLRMAKGRISKKYS